MAVPELIAYLVNVIEEDEDEEEQLLMAAAETAAAEIMELEEGEGYGDLFGTSWTPVAVDINEYHDFSDQVFRLHFRMSKIVFQDLVTVVRNHLVEKGRLRRNRTPFQDIMLMVVWLMATPDTFRSVALRFGVRPGTLYYFYSYVIEALTEMAPQYIVWPDAAERAVIKDAFFEATGFPGVIGCIDCTHVFITAPLQEAQAYVNRHHSYSINVQAVVDNNLLVRALHVGEAGSMNDERVFRRSAVFNDLVTGAPGQFIEEDEHLVGDGAYTLSMFMMIPHVNNGHLTDRQRLFNRRLSQCRVKVENAFGRGKGKWRRLKFLHCRNRNNVVSHTTASFVLHNFVILNGDQLLQEGELAMPINNNQILGNEEVVHDDGNEEPDPRANLIAVAEGIGIEKRLFIMNEVLQA